MSDVDEFLNKLSKLSKEEEQIEHFQKIAGRCTSNDLKMVCHYWLFVNLDFVYIFSYENIYLFCRQIIRLIKQDIRITAGPKNVLAALSKDAYPTYQTSQSLKQVVEKYGVNITDVGMQPKATKFDKVKQFCNLF